MRLAQFVDQIRIGDKDYEARLKAVERALRAIDADEILGLHEEVLAEARERVLNSPLDRHLMASYDTRYPPTSDSRGLSAALTRIMDFSELQLELHAHMALCGHPQFDPSRGESISDRMISEEDLAEDAWFNARVGHLILCDAFPIAYEVASGSMWPRSVRSRRSQTTLIEFVNPVSYSSSRSLPRSLRAYWASLDEVVESINDSEEWWTWLRGTAWRTLELDCGTRDWWSVKRKPSGKFSGTQRKPLKVKLTGRSAKIGLVPNEEEIFLLSETEAEERAKSDLNELISAVSKKHGFPVPPSLGSRPEE